MNWWYPIGIAVSLYVIYSSFEDEKLIRNNPDEFLLNHLRGEGNGFYLTLNKRINRISRSAMPKLAEIQDAEKRRQYLERSILKMPGRERMMKMVLWEIRFRLVAFVVIGLVLLLSLLA
jgi:hypothetical protein